MSKDYEDVQYSTRDDSQPRVSKGLRTALEYLLRVAELEHGFRNGKTCAFWAVLHALEGQIKPEVDLHAEIAALKAKIALLETP